MPTKKELLEQAEEAGVDVPASASKAEVEEAVAGGYPDTPSGKALQKVGPDGDPEKYAKEKAKARWGY